eukprot:TRINITY_DN8495_c0_g4_i1.p5 TRINITY_DN8495_c0_g4~~TRINITY_DN8495_c0_g4_i1.p5  ORF type:complete len:126 (-),score=15.54 TRINITY_DN8495_c0_g4_i1:459-836(-)
MHKTFKLQVACTGQEYLWGMESDGFEIEHELTQKQLDEYNLDQLGQQIMLKLTCSNNNKQNSVNGSNNLNNPSMQVMCFCVPGVAVQLPWTHGVREYADRGSEGGAHLIAVLLPEIMQECMMKFK